jgi:hypothetical protein
VSIRCPRCAKKKGPCPWPCTIPPTSWWATEQSSAVIAYASSKRSLPLAAPKNPHALVNHVWAPCVCVCPFGAYGVQAGVCRGVGPTHAPLCSRLRKTTLLHCFPRNYIYVLVRDDEGFCFGTRWSEGGDAHCFFVLWHGCHCMRQTMNEGLFYISQFLEHAGTQAGVWGVSSSQLSLGSGICLPTEGVLVRGRDGSNFSEGRVRGIM